MKQWEGTSLELGFGPGGGVGEVDRANNNVACLCVL